MKFYCANNHNIKIDLATAVLKGLAPDGGLYMPEEIPKLSENFLETYQTATFPELSLVLAREIFREDIPDTILEKIIFSAFNFPVPLVHLDENTSVLELFHGPTLAFKDFAARFMAQLMSYFIEQDNKSITILVATSGDTGSAVASGFFNVPGTRVVILYPSGKVSDLQEKQLTTMGGNITALEVNGTFDDCQNLVKQAFVDREVTDNITLASANSINIARLLPQCFYYFYAYQQLAEKNSPVFISVPSGNLGNLTAGLIAKRMGLPIQKFIAATNSNNILPLYLQTGIYKTKPSISTLSNAMDVGNPSNFSRIQELYHHNVDLMRQDIVGHSFSDEQTQKAIHYVYNKFAYTMDPHGAVGYLGLKKHQLQAKGSGIFIETAHPAKFLDTVENVIGGSVEIPERLAVCQKKEKQALLISNEYVDFKGYLMEMAMKMKIYSISTQISKKQQKTCQAN